jgi:hypothetical protein
MRFRAVKDTDYERARDGLITKIEKYAYEQTRNEGYSAAQRLNFSRVFLIAMQEEAVRLHLTDGMQANPIVLMARELKIKVETHGEEDHAHR